MASVGQILRGPMNFGRRAGRAGLVAATLLSAWPAVGRCESPMLPMVNQVPLMLKLLTYENSLMSEPNDTIRVGVLYVPRDRHSERCYEEFATEMRRYDAFTVRGRHIAIVPMPVARAEEDGWRQKLLLLDVLYVTPGSEEVLSTITKISRGAKILTVTGVEPYLGEGPLNGAPSRGRRTGSRHQHACEPAGGVRVGGEPASDLPADPLTRPETTDRRRAVLIAKRHRIRRASSKPPTSAGSPSPDAAPRPSRTRRLFRVPEPPFWRAAHGPRREWPIGSGPSRRSVGA